MRFLNLTAASVVGSYLFQRILQDGHDSRFDEIKKSPAKFAGAFFAQATWVSLCLLPVIALNSVPAASFAALPPVKISDIAGILVYVAGFAFEITADWQKSKWMREKREKLHDEQFMTRGLWTVRYVLNCAIGIAISAPMKEWHQLESELWHD